MKAKRLFCVSVVALASFVASAAIADKDFRKERPRHSSHAKVTTTTRAGITARQPVGVTTRHFRSGHRSSVFVTSGGGFGYPYYSYGYPYYSYGYPYSSFGFSFNPFGYYPYGYGYPYNSYYPYSYGYYNYNRPAYGTYANGSIVVQVQTRLARAGYYHGSIDGIMGSRTRYAIRAYERDHGLRVDGVISRQLLGTMGLRY